MKKLIIALIAAILALLIALGVAIRYLTAGQAANGSPAETPVQLQPLGEASPLDILEFSIGDSLGSLRWLSQDGEIRYFILITLPLDTDFKNCVANITLPEGATVSEQSPCYRSELGGRPVLDLTLENRDLIIEYGTESRTYGFEIQLVR